jgi:hypothetical protein
MFSPMYLHASWHAFHHIKACIIYIRVVYTRVRRFVLNKCWGGWCWSIFGKMSSTSGVGEGHPSMVFVSSIHEVGAKLDFCDLSVELTFSATQASPGHTTTLLSINALLHLKSSVMCIKLVGVGWYHLMRTWPPCIWPCLENHMKANEISKGIQIEKEAQSLSGSSRQGGGPNQVRVHLGLQEQCVVKQTSRPHMDSVFDDPYMDRKLIW